MNAFYFTLSSCETHKLVSIRKDVLPPANVSGNSRWTNEWSKEACAKDED